MFFLNLFLINAKMAKMAMISDTLNPFNLFKSERKGLNEAKQYYDKQNINTLSNNSVLKQNIKNTKSVKKKSKQVINNVTANISNKVKDQKKKLNKIQSEATQLVKKKIPAAIKNVSNRTKQIFHNTFPRIKANIITSSNEIMNTVNTFFTELTKKKIIITAQDQEKITSFIKQNIINPYLNTEYFYHLPISIPITDVNNQQQKIDPLSLIFTMSYTKTSTMLENLLQKFQYKNFNLDEFLNIKKNDLATEFQIINDSIQKYHDKQLNTQSTESINKELNDDIKQLKSENNDLLIHNDQLMNQKDVLAQEKNKLQETVNNNVAMSQNVSLQADNAAMKARLQDVLFLSEQKSIDHQAVQNKLKQEQNEHKQAIQKIETDTQGEITQLKNEQEEAIQKIETDTQGEITQLKNEQEEAIKKIKTDKQGEITQLKNKHTKEITNINTETQGKNNQLKNEHKQAIEKIETDKQEQIKQLKNKHKQAIQKIQTDKQEQIKQLNNEHTEEIQHMETEKQEQIQQLNAHVEEIQKIQTDKQEQIKQLTAQEEAIQKIQTEKKQNIDAQKEAIQNMETEKYNTMKEIKSKHFMDFDVNNLINQVFTNRLKNPIGNSPKEFFKNIIEQDNDQIKISDIKTLLDNISSRDLNNDLDQKLRLQICTDVLYHINKYKDQINISLPKEKKDKRKKIIIDFAKNECALQKNNEITKYYNGVLRSLWRDQYDKDTSYLLYEGEPKPNSFLDITQRILIGIIFTMFENKEHNHLKTLYPLIHKKDITALCNNYLKMDIFTQDGHINALQIFIDTLINANIHRDYTDSVKEDILLQQRDRV